MKKSTFSTFPIVVAGVCLAVLVFTAEAIKISHPKYIDSDTDVVPGRYIISFSSPSTLKNTASVSISPLSQQFKSTDLKIKENFNHEFFHGVSVSISTDNEAAHASALKSILNRSDVQAVYPVKLIARPKVDYKAVSKASEPSILPHAMTQVDLVHSKLKNKGKGIFVGVLDTGIDYKHPALGGGFGKGYKVIKGYDLVGDDYTGKNTPKPDSDPLDECGADSGASGHGTHVSGIIAGYDPANNFTGVAPEASLGMWRVFGCTGSVTNDIVIKALLMAYDAGCDVINLSLGETNAWSTTADAEAYVVNRIAEKGVSVVIAAGNEGAQGIYTVGQPSTATDAYSVASVDNAYYVSEEFSATGINHTILYTANNDDNMKDGPIVNADIKPGNSAEACTPDSISPEVKGKIALLMRGSCTFVDKANNAVNAGAIGVVIYNNVDGALSASVPGVKVPVVSISKADGIELSKAIQKGTVDVKFNKAGSVQPVTTAGTVSSFSSTGASAELNFKPQIAGIGGVVYSTLPRYLKSWGVMSGTSMATPYVAGSIALYLNSEGRKKESIKFVHEQFQNYAKSTSVYNTKTLDNPIRQGAGLVQVYDAITQKVHVTPAAISFNDTATHKYRKQSVTITNHGSKTIHYKVIDQTTVGIAPYDVKNQGYTPLEPVATTVAKAKLHFSDKQFKLAPGKSKKITFTVTPPKTNPKDHIFYGGFIQFKSLQETSGKDLKVPYFGVVGKQRDLPIFDEGFPTIIDTDSKEYLTNETFVFDRKVKNSQPITVLRLLTPTAHVKADLLGSDKSKVLGEFMTGLDYLGRHFLKTNETYTEYSWDGTFIPLSVPGNTIPIDAVSGTYHLRLSALKLLGDPKKKKDWETWTSGPIVVKN